MTYRTHAVPTQPWVMHQRWHDLLFAHWPVEECQLRGLVPAHLEIDRFDGLCWIGIVPFWMSNVRPRGLPAIAGLSTFLELNVRTYVRHRGKPGVYFFSLDASSRIAVMIARKGFHLPYHLAEMAMAGGDCPEAQAVSPGGAPNTIIYESRRVQPNAPAAELQISYRPTAPPVPYDDDVLARWLTARYCLYTCSSDGSFFCGEIHHDPWPLQAAEADIMLNTMTEGIGITLPDVPPLLHFSERIDVRIWPLNRCLI